MLRTILVATVAAMAVLPSARAEGTYVFRARAVAIGTPAQPLAIRSLFTGASPTITSGTSAATLFAVSGGKGPYSWQFDTASSGRLTLTRDGLFQLLPGSTGASLDRRKVVVVDSLGTEVSSVTVTLRWSAP